jgi:hypothetical protein
LGFGDSVLRTAAAPLPTGATLESGEAEACGVDEAAASLAEREVAFFATELRAAGATPAFAAVEAFCEPAAFFAAAVVPGGFSLEVFFAVEAAVFLAVVDALLALFVTDAVLLAVDPFWVAATARLDVGAALLTVRLASFFATGLAPDRVEFVVPALLDEVFVPAPDFEAAAGRATGAFLTEVPLLAGVIVPPSGSHA